MGYHVKILRVAGEWRLSGRTHLISQTSEVRILVGGQAGGETASKRSHPTGIAGAPFPLGHLPLSGVRSSRGQ